jgi:hypothetical protein
MNATDAMLDYYSESDRGPLMSPSLWFRVCTRGGQQPSIIVWRENIRSITRF